MLYKYLAYSSVGNKEVGIVNADSLTLAKEKLLKEQVYVVKIAAYTKNRSGITLSGARLQNFTRDLYVLLKSGLPLYDCLQILQQKNRRSKLAPLFLDLCDQVKQGQHLSRALENYPKVFPPLYIAMVKAGEESGTLDHSFKELSHLLTKQYALRKKVMSAMIYPIFLSVFCVLVVALLLFFVVPSMSELFEGRTLHPITEYVLGTSQFLNSHGLAIFSIAMSGMLGAMLFFKQKKGKEWLMMLFLKLPILSRMITETVFARFCRAFSVLMDGGVPLIQSLELSREVMRHFLFEQIIVKAQQKVVEGKKLSDEMGKSPYVPQLVTRFLAIAEEAGNTGQMMEHAAEIYEEDVERGLSRFTSLLQPIILLFLGLIVGVILLSVLLPLTDVNSIL